MLPQKERKEERKEGGKKKETGPHNIIHVTYCN